MSIGSAGGESSGSCRQGGSSLALQPGDVVEVVEGDLMNLQGKVISVEMDTVTIMPKHENLKVSACYARTHRAQVVYMYSRGQRP